jgi:hypothetical protein
MAADAFVPDIPPRSLTRWERQVVNVLAPGRDLDALRVHSHCICGCASISFVPQPKKHKLLAEADTEDSDGIPIWFLLFGSRDGVELDELEIQRADGTALRRPPDPCTLTLRGR